MNPRSDINRWVIFGAVGVATLLLFLTLILLGWTSPRFLPEVGFAPADLTMIPAPTHTPKVTPTFTQDPSIPSTPNLTTITIEGVVQISGTEGEGLRIRQAPGLSAETIFRGEEAEVFLVKDGPQSTDGYTWWYLVAPYDETRAGWAAADYLVLVPSP